MKSKSTIQRNLRKLHELKTTGDDLEFRVAQAMETALLWATKDTRGWPAMDVEAREMAKIIRDECMASNLVTRRPRTHGSNS